MPHVYPPLTKVSEIVDLTCGDGFIWVYNQQNTQESRSSRCIFEIGSGFKRVLWDPKLDQLGYCTGKVCRISAIHNSSVVVFNSLWKIRSDVSRNQKSKYLGI